MSFDLLSAVQNLFTKDVTSQAAARLGESEAGIQTAVNALIPAVLTGLLHKAGPGGDSNGALHTVREAAGANSTGALISTLQNHADGGVSKGTALLQALFGNKVKQLTSAVAAFAGIKESAAGTLLYAATPAILGVAGGEAATGNLSGSGFVAWLNNQKAPILAAVPPGFNMAGLLGLDSLTDISRKLSDMAAGFASPATAPPTYKEGPGAAGSTHWLWSLLLILMAIILMWYLVRGCGNGKTTDTPATDTVIVNDMTDTAVAQVSQAEEVFRERIKIALPNGEVLEAYKSGIEDQLVTFLNSGQQPAAKEIWFEFDDLHFAPGNAGIAPESKPQLTHIVAILKAYPKVKVKIGGYTDRSGDSLYNMRLSRARAQAVYNALRRLQVNAAQVLVAAGYGDQYAKAPATAPEEERRHDRHIAISVIEK